MKRAAPAKINLSLRVLRKRADGFHELETLMAPLTLADELTFLPRRAFQVTCSDPSLPTDESNLAVRAARLFQQRTGRATEVRIELEKRVPHGAGLGGGSSDAAAVLLGLNDLYDLRLPRAELAAMAAELGSDIPFFIYEAPAWCRGRGERVEPTALPAPVPLLLLKPPFPVPTPDAYRHWATSRELPGIDYAPQALPWGLLVNDLERPVFEKYVVLATMKMWLRAQPEVAAALMSGSGSTMFAVLNAPAGAAALAERARAEYGESLWTCAAFAQPSASA
ncbi:MAG: 4-(cytidine 5'-diphospho)-2-C-methyl-D-erythritol kinase [Verrucomicrobia bacterium]|nr:4-(cytidine 5'-diphospho)-2-C-methyl-D-erythritol kinase [Verrucomicrobiota bacterium]